MTGQHPHCRSPHCLPPCWDGGQDSGLLPVAPVVCGIAGGGWEVGGLRSHMGGGGRMFVGSVAHGSAACSEA